MLHNVHRNATVPESYTSFMTMTDSMIHEVDTTPLAARRGDHRGPGHRTAAYAERVPASPGPAVRRLHDGVRDPVHGRVLRQLPVRVRRPLRAGRLRGHGLAAQPGRRRAGDRRRRTSSPVPPNWRVRFGAAYTAELQAWISGLQRGETVGAERVGRLCGDPRRRAGRRGGQHRPERVAIDYIEKPALYR